MQLPEPSTAGQGGGGGRRGGNRGGKSKGGFTKGESNHRSELCFCQRFQSQGESNQILMVTDCLCPLTILAVGMCQWMSGRNLLLTIDNESKIMPICVYFASIWSTLPTSPHHYASLTCAASQLNQSPRRKKCKILDLKMHPKSDLTVTNYFLSEDERTMRNAYRKNHYLNRLFKASLACVKLTSRCHPSVSIYGHCMLKA